MKKNAFTLIELLAVIVILAIIALIAVPIVINIINDSKKSSAKESINLYLDTVEKEIARKQFSNPNFKPHKCKIQEDKTLKCGDEIIKIDIKGNIPKSGTINFGKGMIISGVNIKLNELYYQVIDNVVSEGSTEKKKEYSDYINLINDIDPKGPSIGDKYEYEVMDNMDKPYTFYILSIDEDEVNLILDRNICGFVDPEDTRNGKLVTEENVCLIPWDSTSTNINGPRYAMKGIYNATKNWTNVPTLELKEEKFKDEKNTSSLEHGYTGIKANNGVLTIIAKNQNETTTIATEKEPLKARLPKNSEINNVNSKPCASYGSCPAWLVEYLADASRYTTKYSSINNIPGIYGYWLLSSMGSESSCFRYYGQISSYGANSVANGIRPVITISKNDLS